MWNISFFALIDSHLMKETKCTAQRFRMKIGENWEEHIIASLIANRRSKNRDKIYWTDHSPVEMNCRLNVSFNNHKSTYSRFAS